MNRRYLMEDYCPDCKRIWDIYEKQKNQIRDLSEYIRDEIFRERDTLSEEPSNSHISSLAGGAHDSYIRMIEEFQWLRHKEISR